MHADQRPACPDFEIGHVISVDGEGLHRSFRGVGGIRKIVSGNARRTLALSTRQPGTPARSRKTAAAPVRTSDGWCSGSSRSWRWEHGPRVPAVRLAAYLWFW